MSDFNGPKRTKLYPTSVGVNSNGSNFTEYYVNWIDTIPEGILESVQLVVADSVPYYSVPNRKMSVRVNSGGFESGFTLDWTMKYSNSPEYAIWMTKILLGWEMTGKINSCQITLAPAYSISNLGINPFVASANAAIKSVSFGMSCFIMVIS